MPMVADARGSSAAAMLVPTVCLGLLGLGAAWQIVALQDKTAVRIAQ
jgi:hypothetical protein